MHFAVCIDQKCSRDWQRFDVITRVSGVDGHVSQPERVGDGEIAEMVAIIALNVYTNLFNHVADTEIDFPAAPKLEG